MAPAAESPFIHLLRIIPATGTFPFSPVDPADFQPVQLTMVLTYTLHLNSMRQKWHITVRGIWSQALTRWVQISKQGCLDGRLEEP